MQKLSYICTVIQHVENKQIKTTMETILIGLLIPMAGIILGSSLVYLTKREMTGTLQKTLMGFAAGVMVSASFWSLLLPSMEMETGTTKWAIVPVAGGFLLGMAFLLLLDMLTPHLHFDASTPEGPKAHLSRTTMLMLAVTIHHIPEGMAIGVVLAGAAQGNADISMTSALIVSLGMAIQNIPEGAVVSVPMHATGHSRTKSFLLGCLSGLAQPFGALVVIFLASMFVPLLPWLLSFAAGAMLYVVTEELIPEASSGRHTNLSTIGFAVGFVMMMVLDVVLE